MFGETDITFCEKCKQHINMVCDNVQFLSITENSFCKYYWVSAGSIAFLIFHFPFNSILLETILE